MDATVGSPHDYRRWARTTPRPGILGLGNHAQAAPLERRACGAEHSYHGGNASTPASKLEEALLLCGGKLKKQLKEGALFRCGKAQQDCLRAAKQPLIASEAD